MTSGVLDCSVSCHFETIGETLFEDRIPKHVVTILWHVILQRKRKAWRNEKTERPGKDMKEDYYKMRQDGPGAQTWTDFEEDCDAVNQAQASKINDSGNSAHQRVFGRNPPQMEDAILECIGSDLEVVSRRQAGELTQERSMTMSRIALQASSGLDHKRRWKPALQHASKHNEGEFHGQPMWFWRRGPSAAKKPTNAF